MDEQEQEENTSFQETDENELTDVVLSTLTTESVSIQIRGSGMSTDFTESIVEEAALSWFEELGYTVLNGATIAPGEPNAERSNYSEVILADRLRHALKAINPHIPSDALDEAFRTIVRTSSPNLLENNRLFHKWITDGVSVEYHAADGHIVNDNAQAH